MITLTLLAFSAMLMTLAVTPVCRFLCKRLGWVDHPGPRKVHPNPVPRTGGIAIFMGYAIAMAILLLYPIKPGMFGVGVFPGIRVLLPAVVVVFLTGLLDDVIGLKPWMKLLGQVGAAALACNAGVQIHNFAGYSIALTWWHIPLTVLWLVGCTNAFNLIDGLDGLAVGVGIFATATAFLSALLSGNIALALMTAPLLGALLGFLPYNFSPASIFMGDCGSLTVGFLLGCFGVIWSAKAATLLGMTAPLIALAIPLLDTALAIARRFLRRQPIFGADRGHIHHRLLARGFTPRRVAYVIYAGSGIVAALALLLTSTHAGGIALVVFCGVVWLAVQYLGYEEFDAARRMVFGGMFRRVLSGTLSVQQLERSLNSAATLDDCWGVLLQASRDFGFTSAILSVHGRRFSATLTDASPEECWQLRIPVNGSGYLNWSVPFHLKSNASIAPLACAARTALGARLDDLPPVPHPTPQPLLAKAQRASA
jgi:UDP-GlcNAc:undecaprenyl-phosphate GlcNAc-1-phosphate transferase